MNNIAKPVACKIHEVRRESLHEYTFGVETDIRPPHGQFLQLSIPEMGETPISVNPSEDGQMGFIIHSVGKVTDEIFEKQPSGILLLGGACGKGWPMEQFQGRHMVVIVGGIGLAPVEGMLNMSWEWRDLVKNAHPIGGFKNGDGIIFKHDLDHWKEKFTTVYTLDIGRKNGWETGSIIKFMSWTPSKDLGEDYSVVVVEPLPMVKLTGLEVLKQGVPEEKIWVSFERKMLYAAGKCGHYRISEVYVYLDGSVFNYTQAKYLID